MHNTIQRSGFEAFDCAPALRLQAHEALAKLQFENMNRRLDKIEVLIIIGVRRAL